MKINFSLFLILIISCAFSESVSCQEKLEKSKNLKESVESANCARESNYLSNGNVGDVMHSTRAQYPIPYPAAALRAGITGTVIVQVKYDANGTVTETNIHKSSRNKQLDNAAILGVQRWKINPGVKNCEPIGGSALVTVEFRI